MLQPPPDGRPPPPRTLGSRIREALRSFGRSAGVSGTGSRRSAAFRLRYERFREILVLNDSTLELIVDIEDRLAGRRPFSMEVVGQRVRKAAMDVFLMVKDLDQISGGAHAGLYDAFRSLNASIEDELAGQTDVLVGPPVVGLAGVGARDAENVGVKMANLGEVGRACGLAVPDGFAITVSAFATFMTYGELWDRAERLEGILDAHGPEALPEACREVREAVLASPVPPDIRDGILAAVDGMAGGAEARFSVRSSAVGEDSGASSHAGQYLTVLDVDRGGLMDAYRRVVASAYAPGPVSYRFDRGLTAHEGRMAVGCVRMIEPRWSGILFSRPPEDPGSDEVLVSAVKGRGDRRAAGDAEAGLGRVPPGGPARRMAGSRDPRSGLPGPEDLLRLAAAGRAIETHFGPPQDVEWAIEPSGRVVILQARPMATLRPVPESAGRPSPEGAALLSGGASACPGTASGPAILVRTEEDLDRFPEGGVLVARHSSPLFSRVMGRCAAILTDVGSPTGHMAILAREFGVPAIVGLEGATSLAPGGMVTVDATRRTVHGGALPGLPAAPGGPPRERGPAPFLDSPALRSLRPIARLVVPLNLTDPTAPEFAPRGCRSLHDFARYVHEKAYEVMFHFGDLAAADSEHSVALEADLPIEVRVFDVGGGIVEGAGASGRITTEEVASPPMRAFLEGLLDRRARRAQPRPVSASGFLSVLGESMAGPPHESLGGGRASFAIVSDRYMNFSTKAGWHFSTVDAYCGRSTNKNYIHFRFNGGAADETRRRRRVEFVRRVLEARGFTVATRGDLLIAGLEKYDRDYLLPRLADLGRLTLCTRQLDMLMDSDLSPGFFARAFLAGEMERF